jgi:hypothetical protein
MALRGEMRNDVLADESGRAGDQHVHKITPEI